MIRADDDDDDEICMDCVPRYELIMMVMTMRYVWTVYHDKS